MEIRLSNDTLRVELLRTGDKFAFLSQHSGEAGAATMVVTRSPAVNHAANSCHFRYQPQVSAGSTARPGAWQDNQSWNGAPGVLVCLIDRSSIDPSDAPPSAGAKGRHKK